MVVCARMKDDEIGGRDGWRDGNCFQCDDRACMTGCVYDVWVLEPGVDRDAVSVIVCEKVHEAGRDGRGSLRSKQSFVVGWATPTGAVVGCRGPSPHPRKESPAEPVITVNCCYVAFKLEAGKQPSVCLSIMPEWPILSSSIQMIGSGIRPHFSCPRKGQGSVKSALAWYVLTPDSFHVCWEACWCSYRHRARSSIVQFHVEYVTFISSSGT